MIDITSLLSVALVGTALVQTTPLLLPALGEIYSELSGVLVIGLEGIMLTGASTAYLYSIFLNDPYTAILVGVLASLLVGALVAFLTITLRADQVVLGIAIILLGQSLSTYLVSIFSQGLPYYRTGSLPPIPYVGSIPLVGPVLAQNVLVYATIVLTAISWWVLFRTKFGLKVRMTGQDPKAADYMGIPVFRYRYLCVLVTSMLAGLGGVFMIVGTAGVWATNITSGRGFIALALVRLASWKPWHALVFAFLIGILEAVQFSFQTLGSTIPYQFLAAVPYIAGILVLLASSRFRFSSQPRSLGKPYARA